MTRSRKDVTRLRIHRAPPELTNAWPSVSTPIRTNETDMRFTVKAKLAAAFGVVILLSMIAGAVGYLKLADMVGTTELLVSRAGRMEKAAELKEGILFLVRSEKNSILAASDAEHEQFRADLLKNREAVTKSKDEIYAA